MKKISFFLFLILTLGLLTGCAAMSYQTGHSSVQNMRSADKYVVGQTTLNEVQEELGATMYIFEKENGTKKYVWQSEVIENSVNSTAFIPIVGMVTGANLKETTNRTTLALTFDKNNMLIQKSLKNGDYLDPDIAAMASQMMQQGIRKPL
nr:hypothetical protein [Sulfurospirillum sp. 'SP']